MSDGMSRVRDALQRLLDARAACCARCFCLVDPHTDGLVGVQPLWRDRGVLGSRAKGVKMSAEKEIDRLERELENTDDPQPERMLRDIRDIEREEAERERWMDEGISRGWF